MSRSFGAKVERFIEDFLGDTHQGEAEPENEYVGGAEPHPSEGDPAHGIPRYPHPLPGEHHYAETDPVERVTLDVPPAKPYYDGGNAHGVRSPVRHGGRPAPKHHDVHAFRTEEPALSERGDQKHEPMPVYITEPGGGNKPLRSASMQRILVAASGATPVQVCGRDRSRVRVRLLNEDAVNDARFASNPGSLAGGNGSILPHGTTSYLTLDTQDDLWVISTAGSAVYVSVIQEYTTGTA